MATQGRNWVFTINNPSPSDNPDLWGREGIKFLVFQLEQGADGTVHYQGYVQFQGMVRLAALKQICRRAHWEKRRGTHAQAKAYSSKEDTRLAGPFTWGTDQAGGQGARTDWLDLKRKIDAGASELELAEDDDLSVLWSRNFKAVERYKRLRTRTSRTWPTYTTVLWGPPGVGKSKRAMEEAGPDAYWMKRPGPNQTAFFDGYDGQENVVIDEFKGWLPRDLLCRMCDRYPLLVDTKGGAVNFYPKKIWICSNYHPRDWWRNIGIGPMQRRLSEPLGQIIEMAMVEDAELLPIFPVPADEIPPPSPRLPVAVDWEEAGRAAQSELAQASSSDGVGLPSMFEAYLEEKARDDAELEAFRKRWPHLVRDIPE